MATNLIDSMKLGRAQLDAAEALASGDDAAFRSAVAEYQSLAQCDEDEARERCVGAFHAMTGGAFAGGR